MDKDRLAVSSAEKEVSVVGGLVAWLATETLNSTYTPILLRYGGRRNGSCRFYVYIKSGQHQFNANSVL